MSEHGAAKALTHSAGPVPDPAQAARELRVLVGRLRRRLREVDDVGELTASQLAVLGRLERDGAASTSDLAKAERVRPQSMAATVATLEERGLIVRRPDPDDGRRQLIELTPAVDETVRGSRRARDEWLEQALRERFSERELATVVAALGLLERLSD
jgi:DNA-binding MarR family transcriptional regulator